MKTEDKRLSKEGYRENTNLFKYGKESEVSNYNSYINERSEYKDISRHERLLLNKVINDVSMVIVIWDNRGRIKYINPFGLRMLGYKEEEINGMAWMELTVNRDNYKSIDEIINIIKRSNILKNHEITFKLKDGRIADILWNSSILNSINGKAAEIISIGTDITERKRIEAELHSLAYYDPLTELPNKAMLSEKVKELIKEKKDRFALVYIDIDNFKHINDILGHDYGNIFLKYVANVLKENIKAPDFVAKSTGDEFVIILNNISDKNEVTEKIEGLMKILRRPWFFKDIEFFMTYSFGAALYPQDGKDYKTIIKNAETAMYKIKAKEKDGYCFYSSEMQRETLEYIQMTNQLRKAIENNEFTLYYQPQINLKTGDLIGVEALIRWIHPEKGIISPMEFIPLAEKTGQIYKIEEWVLKTALKQKKKWEEEGHSIKISINLSAKMLAKENRAAEIKKLLSSMDINHSQIVFEITETALMSELNIAAENIKGLSNIGVGIALDDFGTGYSSLTYLKKFPIDIIKLDRDFIKNIENKDDDKIIVNSVIQLSHNMNVGVVAEGIETHEQLLTLKNYNCETGQGYLFFKPLPVEKIDEMLEDGYKHLV